MKVQEKLDVQQVERHKEAQQADAKKIDAQKTVDPLAEATRLADSAKAFSHGMTPKDQAQEATKVEEAKKSVQAQQYQRDMEKMVRC